MKQQGKKKTGQEFLFPSRVEMAAVCPSSNTIWGCPSHWREVLMSPGWVLRRL